MLGQFNQALSGTIGPCLLVMSLSVLLTVGEGRNRPASRRWRAIGVAIGLAAAVVFAILRGTAILNRRSTVNLPTLILGVILDIALIAVIVRSQGIVERWRRTSASRVSADEKDDASVRRARLRMTIHEGRNRQVRRMCQQAGMTVLRLRRVAEGPLQLGALPPGKWRELTAAERRALGLR